MTAPPQAITVVGAGITGLWQALLLARAGHDVRLIERSREAAPFARAASRLAGAMLAPDCEAEAAPPLVRDLGRQAIALWRADYPGLVARGSLVVAAARDKGEIKRFGAVTQHHRLLNRAALVTVEPALADRFDEALYFEAEAHMAAPAALETLLATVRAAGVAVTFGCEWSPAQATAAGIVIDCRGFGAAAEIAQLRGVRGERIVVHAPEVQLSRPVRVLHPRVPLYVVPWPGDIYMIGATVIESDDDGPMSVRSGLELLGAAYALHPGFAEGAILEMGAGVRPALPDNIPRALVCDGGRTIRVNGAYRHGFLLAPILAEAVVAYLAKGAAVSHPLLVYG